MGKKRDWVKIIAIVLLIVFFLLWLYGRSNDSSSTNSDVNASIFNYSDENLDIECTFPKEKIGIRCCEPDSEISILCKDEAEDITNKLTLSVEGNVLSNYETISNGNYGMVFKDPIGYYPIEDTQQGGINVPYSYFFYGIDSEGYLDPTRFIEIDIYVLEETVTEGVGWDFDIREGFDILGTESGKERIQKQILMDLAISGENRELITTPKGHEVWIIESNFIPVDYGDITYSKTAIFLDRAIVLDFVATSEYEIYSVDFDILLDSLDFCSLEDYVDDTSIDTYLIYPELIQWDHMPLKYYILTGNAYEELKSQKIKNFLDAMKRVNQVMPSITFTEVDFEEEADIVFSIQLPQEYWSINPVTENELIKTAGLMVPTDQNGRLVVYVYDTINNKCPNSNVASHELFHGLGVGHSKADFGEIMSPSYVSCSGATIGQSTINTLIEKYGGKIFEDEE